MVTKRVHKRQLLLKANPVVINVVKFTVAYCANKYGIELHCLLTEGNHTHEVATDPDQRLPDFYRDLHSFVARQLNTYYKEQDTFWSGKQTNVVTNEDAEDILERIIYVMGNPVADSIERHGDDHKGIRMRWPRPAEIVKRPDFFWRKKEDRGTVPDEVLLEFTRPPGFEDLCDAELDARIEERVQIYEKEKREAREAAGRPFLCDSPGKEPGPRDFPKSQHKLFRLAPLIGAKLREQRLRAIERLRAFREEYAAARAKVLAGETDVVFPYGTYFASRRWNFDVEPAPT